MGRFLSLVVPSGCVSGAGGPAGWVQVQTILSVYRDQVLRAQVAANKEAEAQFSPVARRATVGPDASITIRPCSRPPSKSWSLQLIEDAGAGGRTRTDMGLRPRDFEL